MPQTTILVEGQTEIHYLRKMGFLGTPKIFNLWQAKDKKLNGLLRQTPSDEQIIIIADTDILTEENRFISNVLEINSHCSRKPHIILQQSNFEDELCFSCGCSLTQLFQHFNAAGANEFKNKFNKTNQLPNKLATCNHDIGRMWSRSGSETILSSHELDDLIKDSSVLLRR